MTSLTLNLPEKKQRMTLADKEVFLIANGDLRDTANRKCWAVQESFESKLASALKEKSGYRIRRAHPVKEAVGHGFISSQREGADVMAAIDSKAPLILLMTAWQYSHHLAPSLVHHQGPILLLANFDGTWPGLVGALCMAGTLNSLGRAHSRLWSENFDDDFFYTGLSAWLESGKIEHDTSYLKEITKDHPVMKTEAGRIGQQVGEFILNNKEITGLFDMFCMGMINGVFPQASLARIGLPVEALSQSALLHEMSQVPQQEREECLQFYIDRSMNFQFGEDSATELVREQVLEQCAMMIAMARFTRRFGLTSIGVQYQQGLKDSCAASDFAEGAIGSSQRFPVKDENGDIISEGKPIPCINEVDMGTAIPQTMMFRLLDSLSLPAETTLHDIRWGSEFEGTFYWDFEISGSVPFEHLKGGIAGAKGYRQPVMYFPKGGSSIGGQSKAGKFLWARAYYEGIDVHMHIGTGTAFELPQKEFQRRLDNTTREWPLMNCTLDGIGRDDLMAGHQSNHITVAYVPEEHLRDVVQAFVAQSLTQNIRVHIAGGIEL
ncbi:hypothetical protein [Endozoicomonas euniceicola]|uniref:Signal transduction protein n=1 Tax=Endozoicomonas euniceicola TaxID=1234143 RepID=A0ABY6H1Z5_9GAMM|nr:hypothetical protein [Endozoicomonas euniceicola]UYM18253.1 hypothetical protein NX720_10220 [Endozoicomonas euniceicola]